MATQAADLSLPLGVWDRGHGPLYTRLAEALRQAVRRGDLPPGAALPPERLLARALDLSRGTVVAAYDLLEREGLLERRQGSGTRVRTDRPIRPLPPAAFVSRMLGASDEAIDLVGAYVDGDLAGLPAEVFAAAVEPLAALSQQAGYAPLGYPPLREAIAAALTRGGLPTTTDEVLVASGAQQAIALVAALFVQRGDPVVVEDPTYAGALDVFAAAGARLVTVPSGRHGVDVERLADVVAQVAPRLVYLIPSFHNPTGGVLPRHRREDLARLAEASQVPLVDDEALRNLALDGREPPPPIAAFASSRASVLTLGSLSKLFWGGLRVGWVRADAATVVRLGRLKAVTDLGSSLPAQVVAVHLLERGERLHAERLARLAERRDLLERLLAEALPDWRWEHPAGGICLWVRLPHGDSRAFAEHAARHGVSVVPGTTMSATGGAERNLRLPFGRNPEVLREGVARLARAWADYRPAEERAERALRVIV